MGPSTTVIVGVLSQAMANEPDLEWGQGRFTPTFPKLMMLLPPHIHRRPPARSSAIALADPSRE
jgi:hypothetical protein